MITEDKEKGNLRDFLNELKKGNLSNSVRELFDDTGKLIISYGIARAMKYLHEHQIMHRNLATINILLDSELHPYLSGYDDISKDDDMNFGHRDATMLKYEAPEMLNEDAFLCSFSSEVYSYGISHYELITELEPYPDIKNKFTLINMVTQGMRPKIPIPSNIYPGFLDLIIACLDPNPENRPTFSDICQAFESDDFLNDSIDRRRFEAYKQSIDEKEQVSDLNETVKKLEEELKRSEEQNQALNRQLKSSYNDYAKSAQNSNYFIGEDDAEFFQDCQEDRRRCHFECLQG